MAGWGGKAVPGLSHYCLAGPIEAYPQRPDGYNVLGLSLAPQALPELLAMLGCWMRLLMACLLRYWLWVNDEGADSGGVAGWRRRCISKRSTSVGQRYGREL